MKSPLKIGIAGLGTVGAGVVKLMAEHGRLLSLRGGRPLKLVAVSARSKTKKRDIDLGRVRWEKDPLALATAPDIDVVVELIGGSGGVARRLVQTALRAGKHVITANKALLALHGAELAALAEKRGGILAFEAAVAGGIPIIKALREGLVGNRVVRLYGILNGTCNYILSTMRETGRDFDVVLAEAQAAGYAEADPSVDVARGRNMPAFVVPAARLADKKASPMDRHVGAYYMRLMVQDRPGVIAAVSKTLADERISLESMLQRGRSEAGEVPVVLTTHETEEARMQRALTKISKLKAVAEQPCLIRIEAF